MSSRATSPPAPRLEALVRHMLEHGDEMRSVVPLVGEGDDHTEIAGSGTLVRIAGEPLLITASHVAKYCAQRGGLRIPSAAENVSISVGVTGIYARDDDKYDVAVLRVADEVVPRLLRDSVSFLGSHHIDTVPPTELSTGRCLVLGFPQQHTKRDGSVVEYGPQGLVCELASPKNAESLSSTYDPRHHFLLRTHETMTNIETGAVEPGIAPHGMSGGSVWWLGAEDDPGTLEERRRQRVRWIGVQSSVFAGHGFLKAASLRSAAALMVERWPELRPALSLHRFAAVPRTRWE